MDSILLNGRGRSEFGVMNYQRLHLLSGFILEFREHLNVSANSSKLDRVPITLNKEHGVIYVLIELFVGIS